MSAKRGLTTDTCQGILKTTANNRGWVLCIGAGASLSVFPSWKELVENIIVKSQKKVPTDLFLSLFNRFGLDALLEAARNRLNLSPTKFRNLLTRELYRKLKSRFEDDEMFKWDAKGGEVELRLVLRCFSASSPAEIQEGDWQQFVELLLYLYPGKAQCLAI